jgi:flagellar hook-basal body complex protein FliE
MNGMKGVTPNPVNVEGFRGGRQIEGTGFQDTLKAYIHQVDQQLKQAGDLQVEFAVGKRHDLHEVMIATEKAGISFRLLMQIRNKLLEAYQEVIRMQF